ncbi:peptidoglycan-binding protein [Microbacterium sp. NPDC089695]|uniref:peptidoglycan-binding protein n=1 Tax=Microbacterium sp. NPDC089695 TaxID=3364198 RepID=UPI003823D7C1
MHASIHAVDGDERESLESPQSRPPRRRSLLWGVAVAAVISVSAGGIFAIQSTSTASDDAASSDAADLSTVKVESGTLAGTSTVPGVLDYSGKRDLSTGLSGVITAVSAPGETKGRGEALFSVNNQKVILLTGTLPPWRGFEQGMDDGPDVKQLEQNLRELGYLDVEPDEEFSWWTEEAIEDLQHALGEEETGRLDLGRFVVSNEPVRIFDVPADVGAQVGAGTAVLTVSSSAQDVTADLKLADQKLAVVGAPVEINLPGGGSTTGVITEVDPPTERETNGSTAVVVPVTITLDDAEAAAGFQRANVTVDVPSEIREGVLSVPVEALLALPDGNFAVESPTADGDTQTIPVTTGLFAGGRVEISGDGVKAGMDVVVPSA